MSKIPSGAATLGASSKVFSFRLKAYVDYTGSTPAYLPVTLTVYHACTKATLTASVSATTTVTYTIANPVATAIYQPLGSFTSPIAGCAVTYSLVDATGVAIASNIPVKLDSSVAATQLIVGTSTDTTLPTSSPYTVKVKATVSMNPTAGVAYQTFSVVI